jgi:V/A-type H+/Na+-transporting ATPase subunit I
MIVPMKKVLFIVTSKDVVAFLNELREYGGLHVERGEQSVPEVQSDDLLRCRKAIEILENRAGGGVSSVVKPVPDQLDDRIVDAAAKIEELQKTVLHLKSRIAELEPFGNFSPLSISELEKHGIHIRLYRLTKEQFDEMSTMLICNPLSEKDGLVYTAVLWGKQKPKQVLGTGVELPEQSLSELHDSLQAAEEAIKAVENFFDSSHAFLPGLKKQVRYLEEEKQITDLMYEMPQRERLSLLYGWCPENRVKEIKALAATHGWGLIVRDPDSEDHPPTLLRLPAWLDMCRPLLRLINIVPGYREYDASFPFLFSMGIFFAILIGDAGYGLLLVITCLIFQRYRTSLPQQALNLGYFFGIMTMIWGMLTGNWFGVETFSRIPLIEKLTISSLNAFSLESQPLFMLLCFIIGASHISLAHFIAYLRHIRSWKGFSQIGWILVIWGIFLVVRQLVLGIPFPSFTVLLIGGGLFLVILFTNPQKNIGKAILCGLAEVPMKLMSCFSDIISYIRLFAVGMATLAVASSFNEIAASIGFGSPGRIFGTAVILILGHGINILMGALSVVVHGLRLNMLEFSGHLNMQWSGVEYQPFVKIRT